VKRSLRRASLGALALAGASAFSVPVFAASAAGADWADVEGRIQYAYYTNDARALGSVLATLKPQVEEGEKESADDLVMRSYFRALTQYRIAQVLAPTKKSAAKDAISGCHDEVDTGVAALPKVPLGLDESDANRKQRAELYALVTACTLSGREMSTMPLFGGGRIGSRIEEAVKLEPKNPRVRLVEALAQFDRAGQDEKEKAAAVARLRTVTQMFEAARAGASSTPEWGAAEAYAFLGRALFDERDVVAAREALERALLIAPDYAFPRKLMGQITR
jgi:tetratricopeptide (TPR) repeat protein